MLLNAGACAVCSILEYLKISVDMNAKPFRREILMICHSPIASSRIADYELPFATLYILWQLTSKCMEATIVIYIFIANQKSTQLDKKLRYNIMIQSLIRCERLLLPQLRQRLIHVSLQVMMPYILPHVRRVLLDALGSIP